MIKAPRDTAPPEIADEDGKVADNGPVLDVGGSSIDRERAGTRAAHAQPRRGAPPEAELPPD